jgi:hypothetical protein
VQGYDRYGYVNNNPLVYTDPSGHVADYCASIPSESGRAACVGGTMTVEEKLQQYNVTLDGEMEGWTYERKYAVWAAVSAVGQAFARTRGQGETAAEAFRAVYGHVDFTWGKEHATGICAEVTSGGCTSSRYQINFWSMSGDIDHTVFRMTKNVIHELGHAFNVARGYRDASGHWKNADASMPFEVDKARDLLPPNVLPGSTDAFPRYLNWQQHPPGLIAGEQDTSSEVFADMFIAWTYRVWNPAAESEKIATAEAWMAGLVP